MEIIASIGPATEDNKNMKALYEAGCNVFRFNCSHQDHDVIRDFIGRKEESCPNVKSLIDIQGIKLRMGNYKRLEVKVDQEFVMDHTVPDEPPKYFKKGELVKYNGEPVSIPERFFEAAEVGNKIFIGDGEVMMEVKNKNETQLICKVVDKGIVAIHKALTVQGARIEGSIFTEKDYEDLKFCAEMETDFVCMSFVQSADDVKEVREVIKKTNSSYKPFVISKIESVKGVDNIEEIIKESDGVMVARGDLALHIDFAEMAMVEKKILDLANKHGKYSVVATGMIESLMHGDKVPSRAEIVDIAVAKIWGASAVMVSSETTVGEQPIYSIEVMKRILSV